MKFIDWEYFENMNDPSVNAVIAKFEEFKLRDHGFQVQLEH
jgi:hypothetical protein